MTYHIEATGLRDLQRDLKRIGGELPAFFKGALRGLAEPIAEAAEKRAGAITDPVGAGWDKVRIGVTMREVYIVPKKRGVRKGGKDPRSRPKFGGLLMHEAFEPAFDAEKGKLISKLDAAMQALAQKV